MATKEQPQYLTPSEVSNHFEGKISVNTLSNWRNLGTGPAFLKLGGKVLYPRDKLAEWEQRNTVKSTSDYQGNAS